MLNCYFNTISNFTISMFNSITPYHNLLITSLIVIKICVQNANLQTTQWHDNTNINSTLTTFALLVIGLFILSNNSNDALKVVIPNFSVCICSMHRQL